MNASDPTPESAYTSGDSAGVVSRPLSGGIATSAPHDPGKAVRWALGAGLASVLLSWLLVESTLGSFKPKGTPTQFMNSTFLIPGSQERTTAEHRNATLALALAGGSVGLVLGLAGGLATRSKRALVSALLGLVLGAVCGAGIIYAMLPLATGLRDSDPGNSTLEMISSLVARGAAWGAVGAAAGLAFGVGLGGGWRALVRCMLGGLAGAIVGTILFEVIGALALPGAKLAEPVGATASARLLAQVVCMMCIASGIALSVARPRRLRLG